MERHSTPPGWLEVLGWVGLIASFASAGYILYDIYIRGYRQKMTIMEVVFPTTALYFGPAAVWFYHAYGRQKSVPVMQRQHNRDQNQDRQQSHPDSGIGWNQTAEAVTHCGAGCTIGDIIGEWTVLIFGLALAGTALYADFILDFALAWTLGVIFQYFTIAPMRGLGRLEGIKQAIKVDTLSIITFQIGLFAGMFIYQNLIFPEPLPKTSVSYWFLMQLSMILGFFTAYPMNRWLITHNIKEAM